MTTVPPFASDDELSEIVCRIVDGLHADGMRPTRELVIKLWVTLVALSETAIIGGHRYRLAGGAAGAWGKLERIQEH